MDENETPNIKNKNNMAAIREQQYKRSTGTQALYPEKHR
jgi:hypothetical protein